MASMELRVHGVSGTPPDVMLATAPVLEQDRGVTRVFRPPTVDPRVRAYQWSSLTSGSPRSALWLALLPYMLLNVAGWALPPHPRGPRRATVLALRLSGVALTVLFSFVAAIGFVEIGGYQLLFRRFGLFGPETAVAVGGLVAAVVLVVLWGVTSRAGRGGPQLDPLRRLLRSRHEAAEPDPATRISVEDPATWQPHVLTETLRNVHIGSALTAVTVAVIVANAALAGVGPAAATLVGPVVVGVAAVAVVVGATVREGEEMTWIEPVAFGLVVAAAFMLGLLLLVSAAVGPCAGACVAEPSFGGLGSAVRWTTLAYGVGTLTVFLLGIGSEARTTAPALMTLAGASGASVGSAVIVVGGEVAGLGRTEGLERLAEGFLVGILWVGAVALALFLVGFRPSPNRTVSLFVALRRWRARTEVVFGTMLVAAFVLTVVDLGASFGWWRVRPGSAWAWPPGVFVVVVGVGLVVWAAGSARTRFAVVAIVAAVALWLVAVDSPTLSLFGVRLHFGTFTDTAVSVTLLLPFGVATARVVGAFRSRQERRLLAVLWDVGSFFPRWFHPFAPPPYGPVAVGDLAAVIAERTRGDDGLLLACHSQGSVVGAVALCAFPPSGRVGFLTFGSPLGSLYAKFFPAHFDTEMIGGLTELLTRDGEVAWVNLFRRDDPIGGPVAPAVDAEPLDDPAGRIHGGYWFEPEYQTATATLRDRIGHQE